LQSYLQKTSSHLSEESLQNKVDNINKLKVYFKKETELWQQQLTKKKLIALDRIQTLINRIIIKVAMDEKYDLILYQEVAFVSDEINISDMIIAKMGDLSQ
jgi:outer membrane protein